MSKAASVLNRGDRVATFRCDPQFMVVSSDWTTPQVDHVPHADPVGDFPQFRAAGREEAAHQTIAAEIFHPVLPALGAKTQPLEDPGRLLRDRSLSSKITIATGRASIISQPEWLKLPVSPEGNDPVIVLLTNRPKERKARESNPHSPWGNRVSSAARDRSGIQRQFRSSGERHPQILFPLSFPT
jgi:hypothetical protein